MFLTALPDAEKHITIREDANVEVWSEDVVERSDLLVPEECF